MTKKFTPQQILTLPMGENDANASNIGDYLIALAQTCWVEEEGFSGKRPFGNSGWSLEIGKALIEADAVTGKLDEDGYVETIDDFGVDNIMTSVFHFLRTIDWKATKEYREPEDWYVIYLDLNGNGNPVIGDSFTNGFTEKEAKAKAEDRNQTTYSGVWTAVQISK